MKMLDEVKISRAIIKRYYQKLLDVTDVDVAICGGGPSGLVCASLLAQAGKKVVLFEKKLSVGGGMWGGGMMFNEIVVQEKARDILEQFGVKLVKAEDGYYCADAVESVCALGYRAVNNGAEIINGVFAEDVMIRENRVCGLVVSWSATEVARLHVDPLSIRAKFVVDATGHPSEVVGVVERKSDIKLDTATGKVIGERSMWAEIAENQVEGNTRQICPGLFVTGMCANSVFGAPRMGPIFGGMILSGKKAADVILQQLSA
jgi:thiamine thiazole synthase